jgi:NitT/TauT family transport system ATP-binding protein
VVMSPRPGRIAATIDIDLPYPRDESTRELDRYFELVTRVRESLRGRPRDGGDLSTRARSDGSFG